MDEYNMDRAKVLRFFKQTFPAMKFMRILEEKTTGSPEFCTWEMLIEIENDVNEPKLGLVAGQKALVRGAAVQQWIWLASDEEWNGDLGTEEVRNWRIAIENDYMIALKPGSEGESARIF